MLLALKVAGGVFGRHNVASSFSRSLLRLSNVSVHVPRLKSVTDARRSACPLT